MLDSQNYYIQRKNYNIIKYIKHTNLMKNILIVFYNPDDVMVIEPTTTDDEIKSCCFRAYEDPTEALWAYANAPCVWSTIIDENTDVEQFINNAYEHIKQHDYNWLEENFT